MTVGNTVIIFLIGIIVLFGISLIIYKILLNVYKKKGYRNPKSEVDYDVCVLYSFIIGIIFILLFAAGKYVILNWNVPI